MLVGVQERKWARTIREGSWAASLAALNDRRGPWLRRHPRACPIIKILGPGCRFRRFPFDSLMEDHMKYMLLIYNDEKGWATLSEAERQHYMREYLQFTEQRKTDGRCVTSSWFISSRAGIFSTIRVGR